MERVEVFAREADVGEGVEHFEEGGGARSSRGDDEEVAPVAGCAEWGVVAFGLWTPGRCVGVGGVEGLWLWLRLWLLWVLLLTSWLVFFGNGTVCGNVMSYDIGIGIAIAIGAIEVHEGHEHYDLQH